MSLFSALYGLLVAPFAEFSFMRHALAASVALALGCGPLGSFLLLRRMSLSGDGLAHAILPGVALGYLLYGPSLPAMTLGGLLAGLGVVVTSGLVARLTPLREDASLASLYILSLALGVMLVSLKGSSVDLMHLLFGSILAVDNSALLLMSGVTTVTLLLLALCYRPLVVECFDPGFLRQVGGHGSLVHLGFMVLVALNLVGGFQALGTLMCVGLLVLPASAARFWTAQAWSQALGATAVAMVSGYAGLLLSYHVQVPSGPAIVLVAGGCYVASLVLGPRGGLVSLLPSRKHLQN